MPICLSGLSSGNKAIAFNFIWRFIQHILAFLRTARSFELTYRPSQVLINLCIITLARCFFRSLLSYLTRINQFFATCLIINVLHSSRNTIVTLTCWRFATMNSSTATVRLRLKSAQRSTSISAWYFYYASLKCLIRCARQMDWSTLDSLFGFMIAYWLSKS